MKYLIKVDMYKYSKKWYDRDTNKQVERRFYHGIEKRSIDFIKRNSKSL